jgi:hypothetical protein
MSNCLSFLIASLPGIARSPCRALAWRRFGVQDRLGPGYRIYFGKDSETLVILVGGGIKRRLSSDIKVAREHWAEYKKRKRKEQK